MLHEEAGCQAVDYTGRDGGQDHDWKQEKHGFVLDEDEVRG